MVDITRFRKFISDKNRAGIAAKILFSILVLLSFFYRAAISVRNFFYDKSIFKSHKIEATIISVGNITTGGTGKTPLVAWICNYLTEKNVPTAILIRGYKMTNSDFADEPAMLAKAAVGARVIVNPDRVAGAKKAIDDFGIKTIVADDCFQHRRLRRDVDIVAIDATEPFGYGRLLPAGLLREPLKSLKRASAVVVTRYNQSQGENIEQIQKVLEKFMPGKPVAKAVHRPVTAKMMGDETIDFAELASKKTFAFCGIGNPDAFFQTLGELTLNIAGTKVYNDHHRYDQADITEIYEQAKYCQADIILTTQKDWTKTALLGIEKFDVPFAYLVVELEFVQGKEKIVGLIEKAIENSA
ncbi:MAG: tetraacyldisaccharide 4'-kinase [Anaerohalosphaeraceae bacterium]|nr:tetraacyldisaccharide 4'-kinase [Anaerohalosphaeraceae bacterium]